MLKGDKVTLRAIEREDLRRLWDLERDNVDLVIMADDVWEPKSFEVYEKRYAKHLEDREQTRFVIEADGKIIGYANLHGLDRLLGMAELGISIYDRDYLGKGYGRDAIKVLLNWAFRYHNWRRIWLETLATNERAIRAYKACGFVEEGRLREATFYDGKYADMIVMGLLRAEWEVRQSASDG